jgi:hypothetical protein
MHLIALLLAVAGTVDTSGRIRVPTGAASESVTLTLRAASASADDIAITCPVAPNGSFHCATPEGRFDVRIAMPGFMPVYRWDVEIKPPANNLGQIVAQRGSSVAGWIVRSGSRDPIADATVELLDPGDPPAVRQNTRTTARGFFQFLQVDPGKYGIRAKAKGTSLAYLPNVVVRESAETLLEKPITLSPPAKLAVSITPHMKAPKKPWHIDLARRIPLTAYSRMVSQTTADAAGNADFTELQAGSYIVTVHDAAGTVFAKESIDIDDKPPPLFIHIAAVPIRGRISTGTTGIKAGIEFSTTFGQSLTVRSNEGGDFAGLLPGEGTWRVEVTLPSRQELTFRPVDVRRRDTEEFARVDLELPPGHIEGRVVDEKGDGVKTGVRLTRKGVDETGTLSDDDGRFSLVGLEPGEVALDAGSTEMDSGTVPVTLSDDTPPITITLHKTRKFKGWITTPSGYPVAAATIWFWWEGQLRGQTMSNLSGLFEFSFPPSATSIDLLIVAPDVPVKMIRLPAPASDEKIHFTTSATPGRLIIRLPPNTPPLPTVSSGGVTASLVFIIKPSTIGGVRPPGFTREGMMIDVDPGQYTVCMKDHCSTVDVAPGAQVRVDASK